MTVYHHTPEPIEIDALTTLGVSVKNGENSIGIFGTGFKYAVAVILREGGTLSIKTGIHTPTAYVFAKKLTVIRDKPFEIVTLSTNGGKPVNIGFTTDLGKHWTVQNAFRELHSNTLDEGGITNREERGHDFGEDATTIAVALPAYEHTFKNAQHLFLSEDRVPTFENVHAAIYEPLNENQGAVYYHGVLVFKPEGNLPFDLNLTKFQKLTEDRTLKYPESTVRLSLEKFLKLNGDDCIREVLYRTPELLNPFNQATARLFTRACTIVEQDMDANVPIPDHIIRAWAAWKSCDKGYREVTLSEGDAELLRSIVEMVRGELRDCREIPIKVGADIGTLHGLLVRDPSTGEATIWLHERLFEMCALNKLVATVFEEYIHGIYNVDDYTASFQTVSMLILAKVALKNGDKIKMLHSTKFYN